MKAKVLMERALLHAYCLAKPGVVEEYPFGAEVTVFKVGGKIFALLPVDGAPRISLKCDPVWADILRQTYTGVIPGYHLNKRHWNTVSVDEDVPETEVLEMIDHSYELVVKSLPRKQREHLRQAQAAI
jgi:predicted DNA-binding protein (MmcQ/YjbR family)